MRAEQHVVGLDVPVQDARRVRGLQRAEHLQTDTRRLTHPDRALLEGGAQRAAPHQLHDDPGLSVHDRDVMDVHHRRVVEPGRGARLAAHPLEDIGAFTLGKMVRDARLLDGDLSVHGLVLGPPDRPHPTVPELAQQPVAARDEPPGAGLGVRGGRGLDRRHRGDPGRRLQNETRRLVGPVRDSPVVAHGSIPIAARSPAARPVAHRSQTRDAGRPLSPVYLPPTRPRRCPAPRRSTPSPPSSCRPAPTPTRRTSGRPAPSRGRTCAARPPPR